jgi:hypothetical protein
VAAIHNIQVQLLDRAKAFIERHGYRYRIV